MSLTLYHSPQSSCSQRVRLVLAEKQLDFTSALVDLFAGEQHAPAYAKLNPNQVVPTLVHDEAVILESTLIAEYLDHAFAPHPLIPAAPLAANAVRQWTLAIDRLHAFASTLTFAVGPRKAIASGGQAAIDAHVSRIVDAKSRESKRSVLTHGTAAPEFADAVARFDSFLRRMDGSLGQSAWLAGDSFTLADASALPYVLRLDHLSMTPMIERSSAVAKWYDRARARPSFATAVTAWMPDDLVAKMSGNSAESWDDVAKLLNAK